MRSNRMTSVVGGLAMLVVSLPAPDARAAAVDEVTLAREKAALAQFDPAASEDDLMSGLQRIEREFPDSTLAAAKVAPLLHDERPKVRRKAIRVLGILQADLDAKASADVTRMLASSDKDEVADALRGVRWITSPSLVAQILPLLRDPDEHVKREACRALAVLGDRSVIAAIEPLRADADGDVREDADNAIVQLKRSAEAPPAAPRPPAAAGSAPAPARRALALKVVDMRPPTEGGKEPRVVGYRRSLVGLKGNVKEKRPEAVPELVTAAVRDGLGGAGFEASPDAPLVLTARILSYWMDWSGYDFLSGPGYKGTVVVELALQDEAGKDLWKGLAVTENQHRTDSKDKVFQPALKRLAGRIRTRLESDAFLGAAGQTAAR